MADNPRSHRAFDPPRRDSDADDQRGGGDPLAELARLIGQNDPFADFDHNRVHRQARDGAPAPAPPRDRSDAADVLAEPGYPPDMAPQGYAAYEHGPQDPAQAYAPYQDPTYAYPADPDLDPYQEAYQPYYDYFDPDGGVDEAEYLDQLDRSRRRKRLAVVAALLAVAVLGGVGAYGYHALFGSVMEASPPPVIKADATPTKVLPAEQAGDTGSNKLIYDRVGEGGSGEKQAEKVVPREEKPVDIRTAAVTQPGRATQPSPEAKVVAAPPTATIPVSGQGANGQVLPVASEPSIAVQGSGAILPSAKKVRTVTIRPDMSVVPNSTADVAEPEPPAAPPQQNAARAPDSAPEPSTAPEQSAAPEPATPPQQASNAPLSLSPDAVASAPADGTTTSATTGGGYTVQVSSQRTEAEAEAAYRTLEARYPNVLGGQSSFVRRADLGSRGIYYRTLVGPFATASEAGELCGALKAAGGQCVIHRN